MKLRAAVYVCVLSVHAIVSCEEKSVDPGILQSTSVNSAAAEKPVAIDSVGQSPSVKADAAGILLRKEVPVLCYHQIREYREKDSKTARDYIVPVQRFNEQMKLLADSGYKTILPDELNNYLQYGKSIPAKAVMITFDDTDASQYEIAYPILEKYGFKGVFFVMTVSIGRPGYMTREQIRELSDKGHVIGSHTWDHHNVKKYTESDWPVQVDKPKRQLEEITGKEIKHFAYPFGLWNAEAIPELKKRGMVTAYQLSTRRDLNDPLYTIRRIIVPGSWTGISMDNAMKRSFQNKL